MARERSNYRRGSEFTPEIKELVRSREVCEICGGGPNKKDPWNVHHKIYIAWALRNNIPHAVIQSLANASLVHESCHKEWHIDHFEPPQEIVNEVLSNVESTTPMFSDDDFAGV